jgi:HTH-type transcriptional regulator / antitoxin HigA
MRGKAIASMTTKTSRTGRTSYDELLAQFKPRPISSELQYRRVMRQIDELMRMRSPTRAQEDLLELLSALVGLYEERRFPAPDVTPGQVLAHLIELRGVSRADVARATGIARQTITNIVTGTRGISAANRSKLAAYFQVSPHLFSAEA